MKLGIAARACMVVLGLLVLAAIGKVAANRASAAVIALDAGVEVTRAEVPPPPVAIAVVDAAPPPVITASSSSSSARATPDDPVFLNSASAEQLRRLPGAGAKRAEAIVALRQKMGRFQRVEDLLRVKGIGRATIRKWRPLLRLDMPRLDAGAQ